MRTHRTIVITFSSLDGVMQDPDGRDGIASSFRVSAAATSALMDGSGTSNRRRKHQDDSDVHHQPLPEPAPKDQDVHADHDG